MQKLIYRKRVDGSFFISLLNWPKFLNTLYERKVKFVRQLDCVTLNGQIIVHIVYENRQDMIAMFCR